MGVEEAWRGGGGGCRGVNRRWQGRTGREAAPDYAMWGGATGMWGGATGMEGVDSGVEWQDHRAVGLLGVL